MNCPVAARRLQEAGPPRMVSIGSPAGVAQAPGDADFEQAEIWQVDLPEGLPAGAAEIRLQIDYTGDAARATLGGELIADDFYAGRPWEINLRCLDPQVLARGLVLKFLPLRLDAPIYLPGDWRLAAGPGDPLLSVCEMRAVVDFEAAVSAGDVPGGGSHNLTL
jgi:beta-galactosidase